MFDNLSERLQGTFKKLRGQARITEENITQALRDVRMALIEADVALPVVKEVIETIKNAAIGKGTKANHLTYIGDAEVGSKTNFGAGTIIANYDGVNKHKTVIGDEVRIGSNCVLVAPVTLGNKVTTGAGSAITRNVEDNKLALARARQTVIEGWVRPEKGDKK